MDRPNRPLAPLPADRIDAVGRTAPVLVLVGALLTGMALDGTAGVAQILTATSAATLAALVILLGLLRWWRDRRSKNLQAAVAELLEGETTATFRTDACGAILWRNAAATEQFGTGGASLADALGQQIADPSSVIQRLCAAANGGHAREDVITARGHWRIRAHDLGRGDLVWRIEDIAEGFGTCMAEGGLPTLIASAGGTVLFMNEPMRRLLGRRATGLSEIFPTLPVHGGDVCDVAGSDGPVRVLVAEEPRPGGRRELHLVPAPPTMASGADGLTHLGSLPVALLVLGRDGALIDANAAARKLIGAVAAGTPLAHILEGLGRPVNDWLADALAGRAEGRPEVLRLRGAEHDAFLQVTLSRALTPTGTGLLAILSDATQLKTLEAQFVQSQKMQAIGQLAGGIAHDFNNLLTAITGHCDLLLLRHRAEDPDHADLVQINQNANRAASLVGQLLAFSRKQTLRPQIVDLRDALADLTHLLNRLVGEKIRLELSHDPALAPIRADRRQLEQVMMNLVVNARDAMPSGGTIRITTQNLALAEDLQRDRATVPPGAYVEICVTDQGTGIPPDRIHKIFEPFYTTKRQGEGTGLGLSMAYGIVKQTGGFIFCDSTPGAGTTFRLLFPAHDAVDGTLGTAASEEGTAVPAPVPPAPLAPRGPVTVLLVEDEAPVRAFAGRALRLRGYTVLEAENAEQALELLEDGTLAVDIFVTDVVMPGMDGPTWVGQALMARPDTRVVFVSGYSEESIAETRDRIPNSVFLPKPFSLAELTRTVDEQAAPLSPDIAGSSGAAPESKPASATAGDQASVA